jgi:hypothetical protein
MESLSMNCVKPTVGPDNTDAVRLARIPVYLAIVREGKDVIYDVSRAILVVAKNPLYKVPATRIKNPKATAKIDEPMNIPISFSISNT